MGIGCVGPCVFFPPSPPKYEMDYPKKVTQLRTMREKLLIPCYFFDAKVKKKENVRYTVIISHGNASDIGHFYKMVETLNCVVNDCNWVSYDYYGYGLSEKKKDKSINSKRIQESLEAVIRYCVKVKGIPKSKIILYGISLGTGVTLDVSTSYKDDNSDTFAGLILQSAFTSGIRVFQDIIKNIGCINVSCILSCNCFCFCNPLCFHDSKIDPFQNMINVKKVEQPVLLINGERDRTVPVKHGELIYKNIPEEFRYKNVVVPLAHHNNIIEKMSGKVYLSLIKDFINHVERFQKFNQTKLTEKVLIAESLYQKNGVFQKIGKIGVENTNEVSINGVRKKKATPKKKKNGFVELVDSDDEEEDA